MEQVEARGILGHRAINSQFSKAQSRSHDLSFLFFNYF